MTDQVARRPHGPAARAVYGADDAHSFAWEPVLDALRLGPDDALLDIGCGGGVFLRRALETGCRAVGLDHSRDMVRLAREKNAEAVLAGRLRVVEGRAEALPFADGEFTAVSCLVAFFFFPEPVRALAEMRRVLDPARGRLAIFTTPPELKGTPAAPYPLATRGHFYEDEELRSLAVQAGLREPRVERAGGAQLLAARF
ncbi:MAG TPA: methyltransferase domain-containing protein [Gaiellaceae bacterium]|jgi:ubiquinone/menaquinone biosynthesis C-methylase UbiE|nr:methyltransferase domain-containing protein [Gaiellaceae bacterium]